MTKNRSVMQMKKILDNKDNSALDKLKYLELIYNLELEYIELCFNNKNIKREHCPTCTHYSLILPNEEKTENLIYKLSINIGTKDLANSIKNSLESGEKRDIVKLIQELSFDGQLISSLKSFLSVPHCALPECKHSVKREYEQLRDIMKNSVD